MLLLTQAAAQQTNFRQQKRRIQRADISYMLISALFLTEKNDKHKEINVMKKRFISRQNTNQKITVIMYLTIFLAVAAIWMTKIIPIKSVVSDIWYLLSSGRYIVTTKSIPHINPFIQDRNRQLVIQNWLSCVIDYLIYNKHGEMGLYYFGGIVSIFIAILTFVLIWQYTKNIRMCISLYCISIIPLAYAMNVRAASITCCLLLIEQIILKKVYDGKNKMFLIILPVLSLLLVNFQSSYWLFLFVMTLPFLVIWYPVYTKKEIAAYYKERIPLILSLAIAFFVGFINPYRTKSMFYLVYSYGSANQGNLIAELNHSPMHGTPFVLSLLIVIVVVLAIKSYGIKGNEYMIWFACGIVFMVAQSIKNVWMLPFGLLPVCGYYINHKQIKDLGALKVKNISWRILFLLILMSFLWTIRTNYNNYMSVDSSVTPIKAEQYLSKYNMDEIKLFSHHIQNNYFEWMEYKVYMDSRPEVYNKKLSGKEDLYATEVAVEKGMIDYQEFLEQNKFTHVITTPNVENEGTAVLDAYMTNNKDYKLVVEGNYYKLYERVDFDDAK